MVYAKFGMGDHGEAVVVGAAGPGEDAPISTVFRAPDGSWTGPVALPGTAGAYGSFSAVGGGIATLAWGGGFGRGSSLPIYLATAGMSG